MCFGLWSRGELMPLYHLVHPIPKWEVDKSEHWTVLASRGLHPGGTCTQGDAFLKSRLWCGRFESTVHWCSRISSSHEQSCSGTRNCTGFLFFIFFQPICLFLLLLGAGKGRWKDLKFSRGFLIQRSVGLGRLWQAKGRREVKTSWNVQACVYSDYTGHPNQTVYMGAWNTLNSLKTFLVNSI